MKRKILWIFIFVSISLQAQKITSLSDLQANDTFSMRITIPAQGAELNSVWAFEQGYKIDVGFQVLSTNMDAIQLGVKPTKLLVWAPCLSQPNSYAFSDFNYFAYFDNKAIFYLFDNNSVTASINIADGGVSVYYKDKMEGINYEEEKKSTGRSREELYIQAINTPTGIKLFGYGGEPITDLSLDLDKIINESLSIFVKEWRGKSETNDPMPWLIDLRSGSKKETNTPAFLQVTGASFAMHPNTTVVFNASEGMPEYDVYMTIGNKKVKPVKKEGDSYTFSFFLSDPKRTHISDLNIDLTPADSLVINYNPTSKKYEFTGRGAENSSYTNQIARLYDGELPNIVDNAKDSQFLENIKNNFAKNKEFFDTTLAQYIHGMNDYWIKSARLSFDYWFVNERIKLYEKAMEKVNLEQLPLIRQHFKDNPNELKKLDKSFSFDDLNKFSDEVHIPWLDKHFTNVFPLGDYLYQPYTYHSFIKNFFIYKAKEGSNTIPTAMKYLQGHIPSYYFADAIFWGYPKSYLTSETLKELMTRFQLDESAREYEDFMKKMHDPEIRESVVQLHDQLLKIEPGANIKELKLDVEKYIPLKRSSDKYIILLVGNEMIGFNPNLGDYETNIKTIYESLKKDIKESNLANKVDICIVTSESNKAALNDLPDIENEITFVSDKELRDYTDKVPMQERCFIILRSNGEILERANPSEYKSSIYFLLKEIEDDIVKQNNKESGLSGVVIVALSVLISVLLTIFIVRCIILRRERTKRYIQELELKAIRAQMNPHFTFNALSSIQNLISQKKDKDANEYLVNFAKLLRMVLSTSEKKLVPLSEEVELINLYLRIEQLRVPFEYSINIDENINADNEEIPGMLIQPIVENTVKHGIVPKGGGTIKLDFKIENQILRVDIVDSGDGFSTTGIDSKDGFGLKSVQERLSLLKKERHLDINFKTENVEKNGIVEGARVSLFIPV